MKGLNNVNIIQTTALLLILGTALTTIGFGIFPSQIYTEKSKQMKLSLLASKPLRWILSQMVVILGAITTMAGSIFLFLAFRVSYGALALGIVLVGFVLGHVFWIWQLVLRIVQPKLFANDELPGWLFTTYSILTLLALAVYGVAFWLQGNYRVLGVGILLPSMLVLGLFLKFKSMPPIVYYAMTLAIGITLLFGFPISQIK
jgi:hypothetical protein